MKEAVEEVVGKHEREDGEKRRGEGREGKGM